MYIYICKDPTMNWPIHTENSHTVAGVSAGGQLFCVPLSSKIEQGLEDAEDGVDHGI